MTALITAIVPIRNRSGARLENCLRSLRWQDSNPQTLEIVVVDYGSDATQREATAKTAAQYNAQLLYLEEYGPWNKPKALNTAIRKSRTEWIFCTDVDMIFSQNFVSCLLRKIAEQKDVFVVCQCHDLPEEVPLQVWSKEDWPMLQSKAILRNTTGTGACQVAKRSFFEAIHGYDEGYEAWGAEDDDLRRRAHRYGLQEVSISPEAIMFHQWHPTLKYENKWRRRLNKWRYKLTNWRIVKNRTFWGGAPA